MPLVTVLLVGLLPLAGLAFRLGLFRHRSFRVAATLIALAAIALSWPRHGADFPVLKRMSLFLSAAAVLLLLLRHLGVPWTLDRRRYRRALGALALASMAVYFNFFSFHGGGTWIHLHDVAHYYLGSKYFGELGYGNLYTAMLRAEAETHENHFRAIEARDLSRNEVVHIRALLVRSAPVKAAFTPGRWRDFKVDVDWFREALGPQYGAVLIDHGFNPTPLWAVLGGRLANLVPAGSGRGIFLLTLLDPILLAGAFAAVAWAFGAETMLLAAVHFSILFGATFGWTGGAFLRFVWLFGVVAAVCLVERGRHALAGGLLALASGLRVFPAFFAAGILFKAGHALVRREAPSRGNRRFLLSFAGTGIALFLLPLSLPQGLGSWEQFRRNLVVHMESVSPNLVGLTPALSWRPAAPGGAAGPEALLEVRERQAATYRVQLATLFLATLVVAVVVARGASDLDAMALAIPLLLTGLNLAAYYYVFLVLLVALYRDRPLRLLALFGLELATYALYLFDEGEALLYVTRSLLLAALLVAFHAGELKARLERHLPGPPTPHPNSEEDQGGAGGAEVAPRI